MSKPNAFIEACKGDVRILNGAQAWLDEQYEKAREQLVNADDDAYLRGFQGAARKIRELKKILAQDAK